VHSPIFRFDGNESESKLGERGHAVEVGERGPAVQAGKVGTPSGPPKQATCREGIPRTSALSAKFCSCGLPPPRCHGYRWAALNAGAIRMVGWQGLYFKSHFINIAAANISDRRPQSTLDFDRFGQ
jgi:hypothetical protein